MVFDPLREAEQLREQLGSDKRRLLFFFGAGTSQAVGLDGVIPLTKKIRDDLTKDQLEHFDRLLKRGGDGAHVEHVLNRIRLCRELLGDDATAEVDGLKKQAAIDLDRAVCRAIYTRISADPPKGYEAHAQFASWLNSVQRANPAEIFSTNYDLLIERGLEIAGVPCFDGFVGSVYPYYSDALSEIDELKNSGIPRSWVRFWKLHGSIGWRYRTELLTGSRKAVRLPLVPPKTDEDLMIFPSREKYDDSRKLPFIALHDRLRRLTASGECLLIVAGYSFSDEHINEILFGNLRANNRFAVTVLLFDSLDAPHIQKNLLKPTQGLRNLTIYAPDKASVSGVISEWSAPSAKPADGSEWSFWDTAKKQFVLGDFGKLPTFLREFIGARGIGIATKSGAA